MLWVEGIDMPSVAKGKGKTERAKPKEADKLKIKMSWMNEEKQSKKWGENKIRKKFNVSFIYPLLVNEIPGFAVFLASVKFLML